MDLSLLPPTLRLCSFAEASFQASKWLKVPLFIDSQEMENLFQELGDFYIYLTSAVIKLGEEGISKSTFLNCYAAYMNTLKEGKIPIEESYRHYFSSVFTVHPDHLYAISIDQNRQIVRIAKPVIQLQVHRIGYSPLDGKFRSMVFGQDSLLWGIQFSYPQLYQEISNKEIVKVENTPQFPNTALFRILQKWVRHHTLPTPFLVDHKKIHVPVRIGKECLSWINCHPQLDKKGLKVSVS